MRLTLRTLLAYLDRTLEPDDAAALEAKIGSSQFAAQLVERIGAVLGNSRLAAPEPDAAGPTEDANVIGDYLDSTLPPEQIADVERACLESDVQLAEVAACHQVLTMVLGTRADVPQPLRQRVYGLARQQAAAQTEPAATVASANGPAVTPVGLDDSGAYRATSRLDAEPASGVANGQTRPAIRPRVRGIGAAEASEIFGGNIRSSRVVPWLVSLALCAAFLFVLAQAFSPLLEQRQAQDEVAEPVGDLPVVASPLDVPAVQDPPPGTDSAPPPKTPAIDPPAASPPPTESQPAVGEDATADDTSGAEPVTATDRALAADGGPATEADSTAANVPPATASPDAAASLDWIAGLADELADRLAVTPRPDSDGTNTVAELPAGDAIVNVDRGDASPDGGLPADAFPSSSASSTGASASDVTVLGDRPAAASDAMADSVPSAVAEVPVQAGRAKVISDAPLLLASPLSSRAWTRLAKDQVFPADTRLICPPWSRVGLLVQGRVEVTLIGPTDLVLREVDGQTVLQVRRGRMLIAGTDEGETQLRMQFFGSDATVTVAGLDSVAAVSASRFRPPGTDPARPENGVAVLRVLSVQGTVNWEIADADAVSLETGQQWSRVGTAAPTIGSPSSVPDWVDPPESGLLTIEQSARQGLLDLLQGDQPVELALREAIHFRRAEVGALAAHILLMMGHPEVYFGSDGVLSTPDQRTYWTDHVRALQAHLDQGPEQARQIQRAAIQMDAASAEEIYRLLWGYSPQQLEAGADAKLVALLDSPQMAVRVLATETLRQITGISLYFRPEQENAARRKSDTSKWEARQRRGVIRWLQVPTPLPADEPGKPAESVEAAESVEPVEAVVEAVEPVDTTEPVEP